MERPKYFETFTFFINGRRRNIITRETFLRIKCVHIFTTYTIIHMLEYWFVRKWYLNKLDHLIWYLLYFCIGSLFFNSLGMLNKWCCLLSRNLQNNISQGIRTAIWEQPSVSSVCGIVCGSSIWRHNVMRIVITFSRTIEGKTQTEDKEGNMFIL